MKKQHFVVGTMIGAVAGLVAGILTAPKSGKQTRAGFKKRAEDMRETANSTLEKTSKNIKDKFSAGDDSTNDK